jgi:hypothetical protein
LTGSDSEPPPPDRFLFFLDEGLPYLVAQVLRTIGYPITDAHYEGMLGWLDPDVIEWLAQRKLTWITKDDEARKAHIQSIRRFGTSVVWVRGVDGRKNVISQQQLHRMLTVKLPEVEQQLQNARGPRHFVLYLNGDSPALRTLNDSEITSGQPLISSRRRRKRP